MHSYVQPRKLVHVSGVYYHLPASILYKWLCFCVLYCVIAVQHEELTNEDLMELEAQRKDEERQDEEDVVEEVPVILANLTFTK